MRLTLTAVTIVAAFLAAPAAFAGNGGCPPGLAKKAVPCVPPGQAKKVTRDHEEFRRYRVGERIENYYIIRDPGRYGLDPRVSYYRSGDYVYQVDRQTREVLALIGAVSALLN